jgi:quercetin dioxygenase-like cupin family protein
MSHTAIEDVAAEVQIQPGSVVSKVIHRDDTANVTVFAFDAGEELTEHTASRAAIVQVLSGRMTFTVDGEALDAGPGFWLHMAPEAPHALVAREPTLMLLTMLKP